MLTIVACPGCSAPADVAERFSLPSTDGPVHHVVVHCAAGHHFRMPADMLAAQPAPARRLRPRTVRLCVCCQENPAGFWVSRRPAAVTRRPWCLLCCQWLDRQCCDVVPFGG
jgi:hypothetical protein